MQGSRNLRANLDSLFGIVRERFFFFRNSHSFLSLKQRQVLTRSKLSMKFQVPISGDFSVTVTVVVPVPPCSSRRVLLELVEEVVDSATRTLLLHLGVETATRERQRGNNAYAI